MTLYLDTVVPQLLMAGRLEGQPETQTTQLAAPFCTMDRSDKLVNT